MSSRTVGKVMLLGATALALSACGEKTDPGKPERAPDFALVDYNPLSPTYEEVRRLSLAQGKTVLLHFVFFG